MPLSKRSEFFGRVCALCSALDVHMRQDLLACMSVDSASPTRGVALTEHGFPWQACYLQPMGATCNKIILIAAMWHALEHQKSALSGVFACGPDNSLGDRVPEATAFS